MFSISKAVSLNLLVKGGQLYRVFALWKSFLLLANEFNEFWFLAYNTQQCLLTLIQQLQLRYIDRNYL